MKYFAQIIGPDMIEAWIGKPYAYPLSSALARDIVNDADLRGYEVLHFCTDGVLMVYKGDDNT